MSLDACAQPPSMNPQSPLVSSRGKRAGLRAACCASSSGGIDRASYRRGAQHREEVEGKETPAERQKTLLHGTAEEEEEEEEDVPYSEAAAQRRCMTGSAGVGAGAGTTTTTATRGREGECWACRGWEARAYRVWMRPPPPPLLPRARHRVLRPAPSAYAPAATVGRARRGSPPQRAAGVRRHQRPRAKRPRSFESATGCLNATERAARETQGGAYLAKAEVERRGSERYEPTRWLVNMSRAATR